MVSHHRSSSALLILMGCMQRTQAFSVVPVLGSFAGSSSACSLASDEAEEEEEPKLVLDQESIDKELGAYRSKYPTSEADYLAAARQRAAEAKASTESKSTDEDWQRIAAEKKQEMGHADDWEESLKEAGNVDSQILMFTDNKGEDKGEGEDDGEQKLILF